MEQFEGFKKLKKMKNKNGMEWEKWVRQTKGKLLIYAPNFTLQTYNKSIFVIFPLKLEKISLGFTLLGTICIISNIN